MSMDNEQTFTFRMENDQGQPIAKGEIRGAAEIPSLDDLILKAVIALLNSVDQKNFSETGKPHLFDQYIKEIEDTIGEMKKHSHFQGRKN